MIEVKVDAEEHFYDLGGEIVVQSDVYIRAWRDGTAAASEANVRRVSRLARTTFAYTPDDMRGRSATWEEVRKLVNDLLASDELEAGIAEVARDFAEVVRTRVLGQVANPDALPDLLKQGKALIKDLRERLISDIPTAEAIGNVVTAKASVGGIIRFITLEGIAVRLRVAVTPEGGPYTPFGLPDVISIAV